MDPVNLALLAILVTIIAYLVLHARKVNHYWKERNIPYVEPHLFIGNSAPILFRTLTNGETLKSICDRFPNEPIIGYYDFMKPTILIKDAEIIEQILIKDFVHFVDRGFPVDEEKNPLDSNLSVMTGKRWKAVRNRLSPIFTTGKLRLMYDAIADCGNELVTQMEGDQEIDMREILGRFAMDVIGSCAFGIDAGNLTNPDNEFRTMGKKAFEFGFSQFAKFIMLTNFPNIAKKIGISFNRPDVLKYFTGIINNTIKHRRENNYQRNDFLQLLMQVQDKGYVEVLTKDPADEYLNIETSSFSTEKFELSNDQIAGQAFIFLTAGFEATTLTMMYTLYELSKNPDIQEKVRKEVQREVKNAGSLNYDAVKGMEYLEQCVKETMRKYPPAPMLFRVCTKSYTLPNGLTIEPGQPLQVSVYSLHYNPSYYPEPEKYKPERFDPDQTIPSCAYIPFGNGPRICIAMRFAMLQMKYCLAKLLLTYKFQVSPKTREPLRYSVKSFFTAPADPILFNVSKLEVEENI
uniref:Putative cytochrome p450 6a2 n=1 Tax=Rhodnius neglectus TaxID=72488 RepID=A0A0N7Z9E0_9HEMI